MNLITRRLTFLVGLTLCACISVCSQVVISTRDGLWTDPTLWDGGFIPTAENASAIVVNHEVNIPESNNLSIRNLAINNSLTVDTGSVVDLIEDGVPATWDLQVFGTLTLHDGASLNGTSITNTSFESGSRYIHLQGPLGFIPYATWNNNSTFEIAGFRTQGYINIAHSDSWKQTFGHVVYNCTQQTTAFVDLNGYLRNIAGDFIVRSTNNQSLRLSTTQSPVISIGGDFIIEGSSKVWFSTNPSNAVINIQGDFRYRSVSPGISYLTTRGTVSINVFGVMEMNSPGRIHMATTSADSTGTRQSTLTLYGDLILSNGLMVAPPGPGKGMINFVGTGVQTVVTSSTGTSFQGNLDFTIESSATVNLGNSVLANLSGSLRVKGTLQVGSTDPGGAIQLGNAGNIRVQGDRIFENGSTVDYNGVAEQWIGDGHPSAPDVNVICNNATGATLLNDIVVRDFTVAGTVNAQSYPVSIYGNLTIDDDVSFNPEQIYMLGAQVQEISSPGSTFENLIVNKSGGTVNLTSPLTIGESLVIQSINTVFNTNDNLLLRSVSDEMIGTASVGPLPLGSSITGEVTVQRYMSGEGRIYRYISSPVQNSTIASLKDDFPVTGRFLDPSTGFGIQSANPSFYYYDESIGGLDAGWLPYPTNGLASQNPLEVGKGYAAFIRQAISSTTWDVTGLLNQGPIPLPVAFTPNNEPSNGWNLVGNPYACAILWDEEEDAWTRQNISSVIAIKDNGIGGGAFQYWDVDDGDTGVGRGRVAAGQSFWVRATAENPILTIHENAKVLGGAEFFRKEKSHIPSFAVSLSQGKLLDIAYYKIRPQSKPGLDDWDGIKLENDNFDISFISADQRSMAILATNRLSCDTVIQLGLKDLKPGVYTLGLMTRNEFSRYEYFVLDKFLGTETILATDQLITLTVTEDTASYAFDRIAIRIVARKPDTEKQILLPQYACAGDVVNLVVKDAEVGLTYGVWDDDITLLSSLTPEQDGDLTFNIFTDTFSLRSHTFTVKVQSGCYTVTLTKRPSISIVPIPGVWADSVTACPGASVVLKAFSDDPDATFTWYAEAHADNSLAVGGFFETPEINKSMVYFVESHTPIGCRSQRYPVHVMVKYIGHAKISMLNDTVLQSNYVKNNQWYFSETKLEDETGSQLALDLPGVYVLEVDTLGCLLKDTFVHFILDTALEPGKVHAYPNPVQEILFIPDKHRRIEYVEIVNMQGQMLLGKEGRQQEDGGYYEIAVHSLPAGNYFAIVNTLVDKQRYVFRFVKK